MKTKVVIKPKKEFVKWISVSNLLAESLISPNNALKQFNELNATQRLGIKQAFAECDKVRRMKIPKDEENVELAWRLSVMVDAHIIATEFNIDALTAVMCINPVCKAGERVHFK